MDPNDVPFEEWFCSSCRTLLFRIVPAPGVHISIRCRRCGAIIERKIDHPKHLNGHSETTNDQVVHLFHRLDDKLDSMLDRMTTEG